MVLSLRNSSRRTLNTLPYSYSAILFPRQFVRSSGAFARRHRIYGVASNIAIKAISLKRWKWFFARIFTMPPPIGFNDVTDMTHTMQDPNNATLDNERHHVTPQSKTTHQLSPLIAFLSPCDRQRFNDVTTTACNTRNK